MDMQNVSSLIIPEGEVRAIHNSNNQLLWGRVNYNTKYAGDTFQQTYSGKNLFDKSVAPISTSSMVTVSQLPTGLRITNDDITTTSNTRVAYFKVCDISDIDGQTITVKANISHSNTNVPRLVCGFARSNGGNRTQMIKLDSSGSASFTVEGYQSDQTIIYLALYATIGATAEAPSGAYSDYTELQIELGSTPTAYEPYVGGAPAPNPAYPQAINVVTGTQMITISDGVDSEDYTVSLGTTELCKIGTYQDYIYKSGDDWYIHKEIDKVVYDGDENESWTYQSQYHRCYISRPSNMGSTYQNYATTTKCDYFVAGDTTGSQDGVYYIGNTTISFKENTIITSVSNWKTWLSSNNVTVYYDKTSSSDTKITDATLIGQLDAIHQFLTRYGYNSNVSGNLPIIIDKTDLS